VRCNRFQIGRSETHILRLWGYWENKRFCRGKLRFDGGIVGNWWKMETDEVTKKEVDVWTLRRSFREFRGNERVRIGDERVGRLDNRVGGFGVRLMKCYFRVLVRYKRVVEFDF
jgi:hypothetical protein